MKIAIFGVGHMGGALVEGWIKSGKFAAEDILVQGGSGGTTEQLQKKLHFAKLENYNQLHECEAIVLATLPRIIPTVLEAIAPFITKENLIISVASAPSIEKLSASLPNEQPIIHVCPNIPVKVLSGITAISYGKYVTSVEKEIVESIFTSIGQTIVIPETQLGIFTTVAGCAPAFVDIFMEALADAGVAGGIAREQAYQIAAAVVQGSGKLAIDTQQAPALLKDQVCSPGGSTIRGVIALEKNGFRYAVMDAVKQANKAN